jgi:chloramphenicol 3-O-phosphotransferase
LIDRATFLIARALDMESVRASSRQGQNVAGVTVLSGPIGAGKTAVSKELAALWSGPLAYIEGDRFWPFLVKRAEGDRREDFRAIMRAMTSAAGSLTRTN